MTPAEAQVLLGMASTFDNRKVDETGDAARAWAAALDGLRFEDCRLAIIDHFKTSTEYLMPAMIRVAVRRMRASRIEDHPPLTPPPDLGVIETNEWLGQQRTRIANGEQIDPATYGELKPRHLPDLRAIMPAANEETP